MDNYVKGVKVIEIYDAANKELLVKYDDKHNIEKMGAEVLGGLFIGKTVYSN